MTRHDDTMLGGRTDEAPEREGSGLHRIDALGLEELDRVVHGAQGYPRYVLGTRERGPGYDGNYTYEEWQRARRRLALLDMPANWEIADDSFDAAAGSGAMATATPGRADEVSESRAEGGTGTGASSGAERFEKESSWDLQGVAFLDEIMGHAHDLRLVVTVSGPVTPVPVPALMAHDDASSRRSADPEEPRESRAPGEGHDDDVTLSALFGTLTGQHDAAGLADDWPGGPSDSVPGGRDLEHRDAETLVCEALAALAPPLSRLVSCLGAARSVADLVESFLLHTRRRPLRAEIIARLPATRVMPAMTGCCTLEQGVATFRDPGSAAPEEHPSRGRIQFALRSSSGPAVAVTFTGIVRTRDISSLEKGVREVVGKMLAWAANPWSASWERLLAVGRVCDLVAHGSHRLMPAEWRARLINELRANVCDDAEQRAILRVLATSAEFGDLSRVLDEVSGQRAAAELLWIMDQETHVQLQALLRDAGVEY